MTHSDAAEAPANSETSAVVPIALHGQSLAKGIFRVRAVWRVTNMVDSQVTVTVATGIPRRRISPSKVTSSV